MWITRSPDLLHWGDHRPLMDNREGCWDAARIGATGTPIETPKGWLVIYHGKRDPSASGTYSLGVALLDLEEPWKVLARSSGAVLEPREKYEREGHIPDTIFSTGQIVRPDGSILLYYGAVDTVMCLAETSVDELLKSL